MLPMSCRHDRPLGLPGGTGDKIAKGTPEGILNGSGQGPAPNQVVRARMISTGRESQLARRQQEARTHQQFMERFTHDGFLQMLQSNSLGQVLTSEGAQTATALDSVGEGGMGTGGPLGLPQGEGTGATAAGSPHGTKVGAKLWLYRVKYSGGDWDANPRGLPALLREVKLATNVPVANSQEIIHLDELPRHVGDYWPSLLFMTGTERIAAGDGERAALRDYLLNGGLLVGDSSGGNWEKEFVDFVSAVLPGKRFRPIELDHEIFRGRYMPYKLPNGCPIYRDHGSPEARGVFADDGRLLVFLSPGDMGSAWAVVDLGKKRGSVEQAFQMGTNLVTYSLMHCHDMHKEQKPKAP